MGRIIDSVAGNAFTRRNFLAGSAAFAAALGGASMLSACSTGEKEETLGPDSGPADEGTWISAACWDNCGGRCVNKVLMKDGAVVRQGGETSHEDSYDWIQQRGCPRGRARQQFCFGADRLKYPMKRKNWQPGGGENSHGELRGKDEWERISWDEAIGYLADEINRIYDSYGPLLLSEQAVRPSINFFSRRVAISELPIRAPAAYTPSTWRRLACRVRILARRTIDMI